MDKTSDWQEFFDGHAPVYDQNVFTANTVKEVDFLIEELAPAPGAAILDVGCGTGRHAVELARRGYRVTGVDLSEGMLARAREKAAEAGVTVHFVQSDAADFTLPDVYDAAVCLCEGAFGLLGADDDPLAQPAAILRNIASSLKPGGRALFTVLNAAAMLRRVSQEDVNAGRFDPLSLTEVSEVAPREGLPPLQIFERAFTAPELRLLFRAANLTVRGIWGGTAGNWGRRLIDLDEIEIMVSAEKPASPPETVERVILLTDVHDFSLAFRDPGAVRGFLQEMYEKLGDRVVTRGGEIIKYLGDSLLCLFPAGGEAAAAACALELRRAFAGLAAARAGGSSMELEVGLASGELAVCESGHLSLRQRDVFGPAVLEAALIGHYRGVAVTAAVERRIKDAYPTRRLPDMTVKWQSEPLKVWALVE